jgi:Ca-activated chloride channel family protein
MTGTYASHASQSHDGGRDPAHRYEIAVTDLRPTLRIRTAPLIRRVAAICAAMLAAFTLLAFAVGTATASDYRGDMPGLYLDTPSGNRGQAPTIVADYDIRVDGPVATTRLTQRFLNPNEEWAEGTYLFPLPDGAAIDQMAVEVNGRRIVGQIAERVAAERVYEAAREDGRAAARLDQERPNMFTMHVANIPPGGDVAIELGYWMVAPYADGAFRLRTPLVVGPRYIPGRKPGSGLAEASFATGQVPDGDRIISPVRHTGRSNPVRLTARLNPGFEIGALDAPYHPVTARTEGNVTILELDGDATPADRDFLITWRPKDGDAPSAGLFSETIGDDTYLLMMLTPPAAISRPTPPRDITFIVDTSGSMHGESIAQARDALLAGIERLRDIDRFNIVRFSDDASRLWSDARAATPANLALAADWITSLDADGGTEMLPALAMALASEPGDGTERLRQAVLMTDGDVGNEADLFALIRRSLGDTRLFTVGIGSAPNGYFMRRAARFGRGAHLYIGDVAEVAGKLGELFSRLDNAVLTDIGVEWPSGAAEMWPARAPDLYLGDPLVVTAKLPAGAAAGHVAVTGQLGQSLWHGGVDLSAGAPAQGIARLWARAKIEAAMDEAGRDAELARDVVLPLALAHNLQTRFTSLVAVDETPIRPKEAAFESHDVPTNLPKGWTRPDETSATAGNNVTLPTSAMPIRLQGAGIGMPQTATPAALHLGIGAILILAGLTILAGLRRRSARQEYRA